MGITFQCYTQNDNYYKYQEKYDNFKSVKNSDSALIYARKMFDWATLYENDTLKAESCVFISKCFKIKDIDSCILYEKKAIDLYNSIGYVNDLYKKTIHNLGVDYFYLDKPRIALEYFQLYRSYFPKKVQEENDKYIRAVISLALVNVELKNYSIAKDNYFEIVKYRKRINGRKSQEYAYSLTNLGLFFSEIEDHTTELKYHLKSYNLLLKTNQTDNKYYYECLLHIAKHYQTVGNTIDAEKYYKLALSVGNNFSDGSVEYNLAILYRDLNNIRSAEYYLQESLKYGMQSRKDSILSFSALGNLQKSLNKFSSSEENLLKAYSLSFGFHNSHLHAMICNNLHLLYKEMMQFDISKKYMLEAYHLLQSDSLAKKSDLAAVLSNLANFHHKVDFDLDSAKFYSKKSLLLKEEIFGQNSIEYAISLKNHASISDSTMLLEKSIELIAKISGKENEYYRGGVNNLGLLYLKQKDFSKSRELLSWSLKTLQKTNESNLKLSNAYKNLGILEWVSGNYELGETYLSLSFDQRMIFFLANMHEFSEYEIEEFKGVIINNLMNYINICSTRFEYEDKSLTKSLNYWINVNGIINSSIREQKRIFINENDSLLKSLILEYQNKKNTLNAINQNHNNNSKSSDILKKEIKKLKSEIDKKLPTKVYENLSFKLIQEKLFDEVFVEIIPLPKYNISDDYKNSENRYLTFILTKNSIVYTIISSNEELSLIISDLRQGNYSINEHLTTLHQIIWKPIADKIGDAKTIYISLGGIYNNINLNTLFNPETGKFLIEEKDIRIVNNARDFVLMKEREKKQYTSTTSVLYGFPDFNGNTTKTVDTTDFLASTRDLDPMWIDSLTRGGMKASPLPATKVEVEQIAGTFQKNGWKVTTYTGENASETNIKKEVSPRVLHLATHGYFFEDIPLDTADNRFLGMDRNWVVQDPMLRSGLLFTGANKTLQGGESKGENGLLSAAEASLLDLRETELVVLSACETGKGELKNSEGVYGLRKAFADAGAQNIIMSLWKVDDKVTQEFMTRFYEIWLNEKTTIREAFNRTQLEIKAKYPQPYYWGAFILVGE
jgi:CHAT domain-containing protein